MRLLYHQSGPYNGLEFYRALKPDGTLLVADIAASSHLEKNVGNPWAPLFYTWSVFHCISPSGSGRGARAFLRFRSGSLQQVRSTRKAEHASKK